MKKKGLFLLASGVMAAGLIGGTFASWAVTDNADPFSIKISTGDVTTDGAEYVTLEWGSSQSMGDVANLALATIRKAGVLDLRANTTATSTFKGKLSYQFGGSQALIDALELKVYAGDLAATNNVIAPATVEGKTPVAFTNGEALITAEKNAANLYTVAINLKSTIDAKGLEELDGLQATLTFDWGAGTDVLEAVTLYATGFDAQPYVYAWNANSKNAEFPGIAMTPVTGAAGYYTAQVNTAFTKVIFTTQDEAQKSGDITIAESFSEGKNLFTYSASVEGVHGTFSVMGDVKAPEYYVVGSFTGEAPNYWTAEAGYKMTLKQGETDIYQLKNVTLAKDAEFKVYESVIAKQWYSNQSTWENCGFELSADGNIKVLAAGTYTIEFDLSPIGGNYIYFAA